MGKFFTSHGANIFYSQLLATENNCLRSQKAFRCLDFDSKPRTIPLKCLTLPSFALVIKAADKLPPTFAFRFKLRCQVVDTFV